jgi:hypothetical protein
MNDLEYTAYQNSHIRLPLNIPLIVASLKLFRSNAHIFFLSPYGIKQAAKARKNKVENDILCSCFNCNNGFQFS